LLESQNITINFAQGIDQKTDPKQVMPGKFISIENGDLLKTGAVTTRPGLSSLTSPIEKLDTNLTSGVALANYHDELISFDGAEAYSRNDANSKWTKKGSVSSVLTSNFQVIKNEYQQSNPNEAIEQGIDCHAWEDSRGGVRFTLIDFSTGNRLVTDQLVHLYGENPQVQGCNGKIYIFYVVNLSLRAAIIDCDTPYLAPTHIILTTDLPSRNPWYDTCRSVGVLDGSTDFDRIFIAHPFNTKNQPQVILIESTGTISTITDVSVEGSVSSVAVCPMYSMGDLTLINRGPSCAVAYIDSSSTLQMALVKIDSPAVALQNVAIDTGTIQLSGLDHLGICWDGRAYTDQPKFYVAMDLGYVLTGEVDCLISSGKFIDASALGSIQIRKTVNLYSKPFVESERLALVAVHESEMQPGYYLLNHNLDPICKMQESLGGVARSANSLCNLSFSINGYNLEVETERSGTPYRFAYASNDGLFYLPFQRKGRLQSEENTLFSLLGIVRGELDFVNDKAYASATQSNNLFLSGGVVQSYDGTKFTEAGFHLYPENITADQERAVVTVTQSGTVSQPQIQEITMLPASRLRPGDFFLVAGLDPLDKYQVWFRIDNTGDAPTEVAGYTLLQVNILSYYTRYQVSTVVAGVLDGFAAFICTTTLTGIQVTNSNDGAGTTANIGTLGVGDLAAGTYLYKLCWKYIDGAGRIHRSATSEAISVVVTDNNSSVSLTCDVLDLTTKGDVILEVYRTDTLGIIYHRTTSIVSPTIDKDSFNQNVNYLTLSCVDANSQASIASNELIYTTGGVLDNDPAPACSILTPFNNRLFVAGTEDKNTIFYSKIQTPEDKDFCVGFSEALYIDLEEIGGEVTALHALDDKLIIFKQSRIYYLAGQGPNNLGADSSYLDPALIATDVGCISPGSIVQTPSGLMFQSHKGIYLLDRSLQVQYIGMAVEDFNDLNVVSGVLLDQQNQVIFLTTSDTALVYDYVDNTWVTYTNFSCADGVLWNGVLHIIRNTGKVLYLDPDVILDEETDAIVMKIETDDLALAGLSGYQRVWQVALLGEYIRGDGYTSMSFAYDYAPTYQFKTTYEPVIGLMGDGTSTYGTDDGYFGGAYLTYNWNVRLPRQKCSAVRIKLVTNSSMSFSGLTLRIGVMKGINRHSPAKSL
jgi:hypothetical protein